MVRLTTNPACCGVGDIYGLAGYTLENIEQALKDLTTVPGWGGGCYKEPGQGFYIFTQGAVGSSPAYAEAFKQLIEREKLGVVTESRPNGNPNHNLRPVIVYVWALDFDALAAWWERKAKPDQAAIEAAKAAQLEREKADNQAFDDMMRQLQSAKGRGLDYYVG